MAVDASPTFSQLSFDLVNHLPVVKPLEVRYGSQVQKVELSKGGSHSVTLKREQGAGQVTFSTQTHSPASLGPSADERKLGVFVKALRYE